jgi:hypothetical protein
MASYCSRLPAFDERKEQPGSLSRKLTPANPQALFRNAACAMIPDFSLMKWQPRSVLLWRTRNYKEFYRE